MIKNLYNKKVSYNFFLILFFVTLFTYNKPVYNQVCGSYTLTCQRSYSCSSTPVSVPGRGIIYVYQCITITPQQFSGSCYLDPDYGQACMRYAILSPNQDTCTTNGTTPCTFTRCRNIISDPYVYPRPAGIADAVSCGGSAPTPTPGGSCPAATQGANCTNAGGTCINTNCQSCTGGQIQIGLCPGAANFRCCVPNPTNTPTPTPTPASNLTITDITYTPASPVVGDSVTFSHVIQNLGSYLSTDFTNRLSIDSGLVIQDRTIASNLSTNEQITRAFTTPITASVAGDHQVSVCADQPNAISESNEGDNCRVETVTVITPTPTPTPIINEPWCQFEDATVVSDSSIVNPIPASPILYDGSGPGNRVLVDGTNPGVISAQSISISGAAVSSKGWKITGQTYQSYNDVQGYIDYALSKQSDKVVEITTINGAKAEKINILTPASGSISITNGQLAAKRPLLLIVVGNVTFTTDINTTNEPQIIAATGSMTFSNTVSQANGIFIADSIDFGTTTDLGVKVIGNIISENPLTCTREWSNTNRPGTFITFDPSHYLKFIELNLFSKTIYDWRQIQ